MGWQAATSLGRSSTREELVRSSRDDRPEEWSAAIPSADEPDGAVRVAAPKFDDRGEAEGVRDAPAALLLRDAERRLGERPRVPVARRHGEDEWPRSDEGPLRSGFVSV
jgi:hypothetical protein